MGKVPTQMKQQMTNLKVVRFLKVLDPLVGLSLGVYHERPSSCVGHNDTVVNGEAVGREAGYVPVSDLDRVTEGLGETEVSRTGNLHRLHKKRRKHSMTYTQ